MKKLLKDKKGISIIEILVVLFIIGIMMTIILPKMSKPSKGTERHVTAETIAAIFRQARQQAILNAAQYEVTFTNGNRVVNIRDVSNGQFINKSYLLPDKIQFNPIPGTFRFEANGYISLNPGTSLRLENKNNLGVFDTINITLSTGQARVRKNQ